MKIPINRLKIFITLAMLINGFCANAMSNSDFLKLNSNSSSANNRLIGTVYVHGVTMGFMVSGVAGKDRSICFPGSLSIDEFNYVSLIKGEMELDNSVDGDFPAAITLYRAFKRKFPCK
ncbi:hypothetical protein [Limnohabitans sp.]|uniref:hypothetical protein n=1 Tax=Limnohabitans sp. TaxID=1907725 RepID=UPI00289B2F0E|nr:hypothetical protein [Limnohabitans sp.]